MAKTLKDLDFENKKVIIRCGFDMPVDAQGNITDDTRIKGALPTLNYLIEKKAKIIIVSHHHRPKKWEEKYKHNKIAKRLSLLLHKPVKKMDECFGPDVKKAVDEMMPSDIILLENVRFHEEEMSKDEKKRNALGKKIALLGEVYVNEAFSNSHRNHASMTSIPKFVKEKCIGFQVQKELETIEPTVKDPEHPFVVVLGGAKLSTKIPMIENVKGKADKILLGGAMIFTFYKAMGYEVGTSLVDEDNISTAKKILEDIEETVLLPTDVVIAERADENCDTNIVAPNRMPKEWIGLDIGPDTIDEFRSFIGAAKTVVWNGPLGMFEIEKFAIGTIQVAKILAECEAKVIIGGGDSAAAIRKAGVEDKIFHISSGGGASLALFSGKKLVAIRALE